MRRIFAIIALTLLCGAFPASAQEGGVVVTPKFPLGGTGRVDLRPLVAAHYGLTLALLEREFPADHAQLLARIDEIGRSGAAGPLLLVRVAEQFTQLKRKYADRLLFAPSVSHAIMLGRLGDFYDAVLRAEGPTVCGRFARDGSAVLFELGLSGRYAELLDLQSAAFFDAVVQAIEAPEPSGAAALDDWAAVFAAMVAAGAPESYISTIQNGQSADPDLCPALAAMFRASGLLPTPEGARTRADFAKNLTGY